MNKRLFAAVLILALGAGYSLGAVAQVKPETLVKQRQGKMALQGKYLFPLVAMAQGKVPYDANVVARNVAFLGPLTEMAWDAFDPSTSDEKNTRALPEIYKDPAKFKGFQDSLHSEIATLVAASKGGNEAATKAAIGGVGKVCGGCHQAFRSN